MGPEFGFNQNQRSPSSAYLWWCPWLRLSCPVAYPLLWHPVFLDYDGILHSSSSLWALVFVHKDKSTGVRNWGEGLLYTISSFYLGFRCSWGAQLNAGARRHFEV